MTKITTDAYFGGCPVCGKTDGYMNIGREHWFVCDEHMTKWHIGSNLFSCWRDEAEAVWQQNTEKLAGYRDVKPIYPKPTEQERRDMEDHETRLAEARRLDSGYGVEMGPGDTMRALGPDDDDIPF